MNYLGIDFGTTGISAILLNQKTGQRYPIYWWNDLQRVNSQVATRTSGEAMFRLPTVSYSGPAASQLFVEPSVSSVVVGSLAASLAKEPGIYLHSFKPYLKIGIPFYCQDRHEWEPTLRLPGDTLLSLYWVRRALQAIIATLKPQHTLPNGALKVGAVGLESEALAAILSELEGVILNCPVNWGDTYQINLREAVLEAKLVREPRQIFFLSDAVATILAALPTAEINVSSASIAAASPNSVMAGLASTRSSVPVNSDRLNLPPQNHHNSLAIAIPSSVGEVEVSTVKAIGYQNLSSWGGSTLAINAGAMITELAIVNLPDNLQNLTHQDFHLWSWSYGGEAIDQDIVWQLLYPQMSEEQKQQLCPSSDLEIPLSGQADQPKRDRALAVLQSSAFGLGLLKAAEYLKQIVQHKEEFTLNVGTQCWTVKRRDLEAKVIFPFVEHLNQQLNSLLIKSGFSQQGITQVICQGGSTAFATVKRWLQQKLPNAILIEDSDLPERSWVAAGLANLPVYPQVLDYSRQQYSDYFLLLELLRAFANTKGEFPGHVYSIKEIMQKLERRGLNTTACYQRLIPLLDGNLPPGLVPSIDELTLLAPASQENLHYSRLNTGNIFEQVGDGLYRPNREQQEHLLEYINTLLYSTFQTFEEPLIVNL